MSPLDIRIYPTLRDIPPQDWNLCFSNTLENYSYLIAAEESGLKGFTLCYVTAWRKGLMIGAMPGFLTRYDLCTTVTGRARNLIQTIRKAFPGFLKMSLACIGSPVTETALMGIHPHLPLVERLVIFRRMVEGFERHAALCRQSLIGFKDIPDKEKIFWGPNLKSQGYHGLPGLPVATLPIDFQSIDEYLGRLSYMVRKDMRRKLRSMQDVRIEYRNNVDDVLPQIMGLYYQTLARSDMQFEELTPEFFQGVLRHMPQESICVLYYVGEALIGANLLLKDEYILLDKFFCMDEILGRQHNLYFLSWFTNLAYCLEYNLLTYQSGQAAYDIKLRLRSHLVNTTMYFRHSNTVIQFILNLISPVFAIKQPQEITA